MDTLAEAAAKALAACLEDHRFGLAVYSAPTEMCLTLGFDHEMVETAEADWRVANRQAHSDLRVLELLAADFDPWKGGER